MLGDMETRRRRAGGGGIKKFLLLIAVHQRHMAYHQLVVQTYVRCCGRRWRSVARRVLPAFNACS